MSFKPLLYLLIFSILSIPVNAQTDSLFIKQKKEKTFLQKAILPASLIVGGSLLSGSHFEKDFQREVRHFVGNNYAFEIDDYTLYVPIVEMYAADALGVQSKNHWFDQTKNLVIANIVSDYITFKLKVWTKKRRPNGDDDLKSFPSGHTSRAFTNAGILYHEFIDTSPFLAYSGYAFATTTGVFRVMNNAHWVSDVIVSSGIAILVTELVYLLDPIIKWNPFKNTKGISFIPRIDNNHYGFYLSMNF